MALDRSIGEVDQNSINYDGTVSGSTHYISGKIYDTQSQAIRRTTVAENLLALDEGLYQETIDRAADVNAEEQRAKDVEGKLADLTTNDKSNLVAAINSESTRAKGAESVLQNAITAEVARAKGVEGKLADLTGNAQGVTSLVEAINAVDTAAVHLAGNETIAGQKTFRDLLTANGGINTTALTAATVKGTTSVTTPKLVLSGSDLTSVDVVAEDTDNSKIVATKASVNEAIEGLGDNIGAKLGKITSSEGGHLTVAAFSADNTVAGNLMNLDSSIGKIKGLRKTDSVTGEQVIDPQGGTHYIYGVDRTYGPGEQPINRSVSVAENLLALDEALYQETIDRADDVDAEEQRATGVEGKLADLKTNDKSNLVAAINSEMSRAESVEGDLNSLTTDNKRNLVAAINSEMSRAERVEGNLNSLTTNDKSNLVAAINELQGQTSSYATKVEVHGNGAGTTVALGDLADSTTIGQAKGIVSVDSVNGAISLNTQDEEGKLTTGVAIDGKTNTVSIATSDEDGAIYGLTVNSTEKTTTIGSDENHQIVIGEGDLSTTGKVEVGTDLTVAGKATFGADNAQVTIEGGSIVVAGDVKAASLTLDNKVSKIDTGSVITSENAAADTLATIQTISATVGNVKGMTGNNFLADAVTVADQLQRLDAIIGDFKVVRTDVAGDDIVDVLNNLDVKIDESAGNIEKYVNRRFAGGYFNTETGEWVHEPIVLGNLASSITIGTEETGMVFDPEDKTVAISTLKDGVNTGILVDAAAQKIVLGSSKASGKSFGITIDSDLSGDGDGSKVVIGDGEKDVTIADGKVTADAIEAKSAEFDTVTADKVEAENAVFNEGVTVGDADGTNVAIKADGSIVSTVEEAIPGTTNANTKSVEIADGAVTAKFADGNGVVKEEIKLDHGEIKATSTNRDDQMMGEVVISKGGVSAVTKDAQGNIIGETSMLDGNIAASNSATIGTTGADGELAQGVQMKADGSITSIDEDGNTVEIGSGAVVASNAVTAGKVDENGNLTEGVQMSADGSIASIDKDGNKVTVANGTIKTENAAGETVEIADGEVVASNAVTAGTVDENGELTKGVQMGADGSIASIDENGNKVTVANGTIKAENAAGETVEIADGSVVASNAVTAGKVGTDGTLTEGVQMGADGSITSIGEDGKTVTIADGNITASGKIDAAEIEVDDISVNKGQFNESLTVGTVDDGTGELVEGAQIAADGSFVSKNDEGEVTIADGNITASNSALVGSIDDAGALEQGVQMGADGSITSIGEEGKTVTIADGNIDALSGAFKDSLKLGNEVVTQIDTALAPVTSESFVRGEGEEAESYADKVLITAAALNGTVGDVATLGVGKDGTNLGKTGQETVADQLGALDDAIGDRTYEGANVLTSSESVADSLKAVDQAIGNIKQFAAEEYEGFAKGAGNLSQAIAQVDKQVVANTDHIGDMNFAEVGVQYGVGSMTDKDLTQAVSQLGSNIGSGEVLDSIASRSEVAHNNGVSSENTVNENIAAVNASIGDLKNLSLELKNLTNGGENVPTTVVSALNNLNSTLGQIHGLFDGEKVNTTGGIESTTGSHSNLAQGTTVEMHLVSLDNAIGDRSSITNKNGSNDYVLAERDSVADVLSDIASQIGTADQLGKEVINNVSAQNTVNQNIAAVNTAIGNVSELEDTYFLSDTTNLTDAIKVLDEDMYQLTDTVNTTWRDLKELHHEFRRGMASMAAMSALVPNPRAHGKTSLSLGTGAYGGHGAVAVGGFHNITDNLMLNAGMSWSDSSDASYRMGVTYSF